MTKKQTVTTEPVLSGARLLDYLKHGESTDLLKLALCLQYGEWDQDAQHENLAIGKASGLAGGYVLRRQQDAERLLELITNEMEV